LGDGVVPGWGPQAAVRVDPHASAGGLICVSYLLWGILWIVLYGPLGGRETIGTLPVRTAIFLGATLLSSLIAEVSFTWLLVH
jgi:hypothetical protein